MRRFAHELTTAIAVAYCKLHKQECEPGKRTVKGQSARMLEHYWTRLQKGERSQDGSKVEVPGFLVPVTSAPPGNYLWRERRASTAFDLGAANRMDLRFEHDDVAVTSIQTDGRVVMTDTTTGRTRLEVPTPR